MKPNPPQHKKFTATLTVFGFLVLKSAETQKEAMVGGRKITLQPRQVVTCFREVSEATGLHEESARRALNRLEEQGFITRDANNHFSVVTINKNSLPVEC